MPIKNIIPGQRVTKEKLDCARELRRDGQNGLHVIRFKNKEVIRNLPGVLEKIRELVSG